MEITKIIKESGGWERRQEGEFRVTSRLFTPTIMTREHHLYFKY